MAIGLFFGILAVLLVVAMPVGGVFGMILAVPLGLLAYTMYQDGVFDTTRSSLMILVAGINQFRRLDGEDLQQVEEMESRNQETIRMMESQRAEEEALRDQEKVKNSAKRSKREKRWGKK